MEVDSVDSVTVSTSCNTSGATPGSMNPSVHPYVWPKWRIAELRQHLGEVFRRLAEQKESRVEEGHLMSDHVHMMLSISPKYAVSQVVWYIKGKSAIQLAPVYGERKRNFVGQTFWARGYFVSTVGRDETVIREYIRNQGARGQALGPTQPVAMSGRRYGGQEKRGRVSDAI
jgi:putative transposase